MALEKLSKSSCPVDCLRLKSAVLRLPYYGWAFQGPWRWDTYAAIWPCRRESADRPTACQDEIVGPVVRSSHDFFKRTADDAHVMTGRKFMEDGIGLAGPIEVGDDSAFFLPGFTEGIFQQASGIADGRHRNLLRSVEMAQSRIGKAVNKSLPTGHCRQWTRDALSRRQGRRLQKHGLRKRSACRGESFPAATKEGPQGPPHAAKVVITQEMADDGRFRIRGQ